MGLCGGSTLTNTAHICAESQYAIDVFGGGIIENYGIIEADFLVHGGMPDLGRSI
jgi:hypothetical protein